MESARLKGSLGRIEEEDEEEAFSEVGPEELGEETNNSKKARAQRFDFRLNNQYYILNIKVDEEGQRIKASSNLQGRVVSKTPINISNCLLDSKADHVRQTIAI